MLNINFDSLQKTEVFISGLDQRLQNHTAVLERLSLHHSLSVRSTDIFGSGGRGLWAGLDPLYAARKAVTHPGKGILRRDGTYMEAANLSEPSRQHC